MSPCASVSDEPPAATGTGGARLIRVGSPGIGADWHAGASHLAVLQAVEDAPSLGAALSALAAAGGLAAGTRDGPLTTVREARIHGVLEVAS